MKPVTLAVFNSRDEAEPIRQRLCEAGIWAEVRPETDSGGLLRFARPAAGVKLEVPRDDFEEALRLLYGWNTGNTEAHSHAPFPWITGKTAGPPTRKSDPP